MRVLYQKLVDRIRGELTDLSAYVYPQTKIRAVRRHHRKRIILKRYERVERGYWYVKNPGYLSKNNTVCSCCMCGNPRKYFGERTVQEKRVFKDWSNQ
jgi:hypothetical protein